MGYKRFGSTPRPTASARASAKARASAQRQVAQSRSTNKKITKTRNVPITSVKLPSGKTVTFTEPVKSVGLSGKTGATGITSSGQKISAVGSYNPRTGVLTTAQGGVSTAFPDDQPKKQTNDLNWIKGSALKGYAQTFQNYSKLQPTSYATQSKAFTIPSNVKNSFILNQLYQQAKTQAQRDQVNNITNYQSNIKRFTPTPQILTANQAIRQANVVVQAAKTASISRKYVQPTISGVR